MRNGVLAVVYVAACSDGGNSAPDAATLDGTARQVVMEEKALLVGELGEAVLEGGQGDVARISLMAPNTNLDWNIHGHTGGETQTIAEGLRVMSVDYTFAPSAQTEWYLLLRNRDVAPMTTQVRIELHGNMQWRGWQ